MKLEFIRKEIHDYVNKADERFIKLVFSMVVAEKKGIFKKFDADDMTVRAELSEKDIAAGRTIKAEDLKNEFESWKKKKAGSK